MTSGLCELPPDPAAGCCAAPTPAAAAPIRPSNPAGLSQISYRIGTFSTFRRAMLDDLATALEGWRETGADRDYAIAIVELWAYIGDILTFYQERIANEAYLPTASQPNPTRWLAELIGYHPSPGASALTVLGFTAAPSGPVNVPKGLRVGNRPAPGVTMATFETSAAIVARAEHSAIALASSVPANQFAALSAISGALGTADAGNATRLAADLQAVFPAFGGALSSASAGAPVSGASTASASTATMPPASSPVRQVRLAGVNLRLSPGQLVLVFDDQEASSAGNGLLRELTGVTEHASAGFTTITWLEDEDYAYQTDSPRVYALRTEAIPFGYNAPPWASLQGSPLQGSVDWDSTGAYLPDSEDHNVLYLDRTYPGITVSGPGCPSLVTLVDSDPPGGPDGAGRVYQTFAVTAADNVTYSNFTLTGRVTRLTLDGGIVDQGGTFPRRRTTVMAQSEPLALYDLLELPQPVSGDSVILDGLFPHLTAGQQVVVRGATVAADGTISTETSAEAATILNVGPRASTMTTLIRLTDPLSAVYARSSTQVLANVAAATHGETVKNEILGSGDGSAWQTFSLRKTPLTELPTTGPSENPLQPALTVTVNGVSWEAVDKLADAAPAQRAYMLRQDSAQQTTIMFGDTTARPPTGAANILARYRVGLGSPGALEADALVRLIDTVPGLTGVTNPEPTSGGADPETAAEIRTNAPASLRTFGRAVSLDDYPELALTFPGVAMARAGLVRQGEHGPLPRPEVRLTVAGPDRQALPTDMLARLRTFLDARRDPNVPLRLTDFDAVPVTVSALIDVDDAYGRRAVLTAAQSALGQDPAPDGTLGYFGRLGFGDSVYLSSVYAALQAVPGVQLVTVQELRGSEDPAGSLLDTIAVGSTALAVVANQAPVQLGSGGRQD